MISRWAVRLTFAMILIGIVGAVESVTTIRHVVLSLALALPSLAFGQAYRCKLANGSTSFQGQPCAAGAVGSQVTLKPAAGPADAPVEPPKAAKRSGPKVIVPPDAPSDYQRRLADERIDAENAKIRAYNRNLQCNRARQQLGVMTSSRPAYSFDNKGERTYIKDDDRAAKTAAAERRVAEECK